MFCGRGRSKNVFSRPENVWRKLSVQKLGFIAKNRNFLQKIAFSAKNRAFPAEIRDFASVSATTIQAIWDRASWGCSPRKKILAKLEKKGENLS